MKYFLITVIVLAFIYGIAYEATRPCTLSFEVHKGLNFNQPYPTYHHCESGIDHVIQTTDIYGNKLK